MASLRIQRTRLGDHSCRRQPIQSRATVGQDNQKGHVVGDHRKAGQIRFIDQVSEPGLILRCIAVPSLQQDRTKLGQRAHSNKKQCRAKRPSQGPRERHGPGRQKSSQAGRRQPVVTELAKGSLQHHRSQSTRDNRDRSRPGPASQNQPDGPIEHDKEALHERQWD